MNKIIIVSFSLLLITVFIFGFFSYHVFFQQPIQIENNCMTSYKVSRLSNIYSAIIYDASYFGKVNDNTKEMINNYKIEFGENVPPITVSVVGDN